MKQHITEEQHNQISQELRQKLREWMTKKNYPLYRDDQSLLTIGQMIEFLGNDWHFALHCGVYDGGDSIRPGIKHTELCNELWQAVKEVLEAK